MRVSEVRFTFTKRKGKADELLVEYEDGSSRSVSCPKQGMIPHEMVHYAVETVVPSRGFLSKVAGGEAANFIMDYEAHAEAVERLVETVQAEIWSGRVSEADFISTYEHACAARNHAVLRVSDSQVHLMRQEIDSLTIQWEAVPLNGSLTLRFDPTG